MYISMIRDIVKDQIVQNKTVYNTYDALKIGCQDALC